MKRTIVKVKANRFNDFCMKLRNMFVYDVTVKSAMTRHRFYDNITGKVVAEYNEKNNYGVVYNYNTHVAV